MNKIYKIALVLFLVVFYSSQSISAPADDLDQFVHRRSRLRRTTRWLQVDVAPFHRRTARPTRQDDECHEDNHEKGDTPYRRRVKLHANPRGEAEGDGSSDVDAEHLERDVSASTGPAGVGARVPAGSAVLMWCLWGHSWGGYCHQPGAMCRA